jgi:hypothetical protein
MDIFKLTPMQSQALKMVSDALNSKSYRIKFNEMLQSGINDFYSLEVILTLSSGAQLLIDSFDHPRQILLYNEDETKQIHVSEIYSDKAYFLILDHFKKVLKQKEQNLIFEKEKEKIPILKQMEKEIIRESVRKKMGESF